MPTIQIYRKGNLQEEKGIKNTCWLILCNSGEIICLVDQEKDRGGGGVFQSIVYFASENPEISGVFPNWELIIDGVPQPRQFYESVTDIKGKVVQLRYKDYECVLDFS